MKLFVVAALAFSSLAFGCAQDGSSGFLPKNNLYIPVGAKTTGGLTEAQFNAVIDEVSAVMSPIVAKHGGKLVVVRNWTDGEVNAFATREEGAWQVQMFGGLARHSTITEDGFRLVLCHEIGHHIGGAPTKTVRSWSSVEGQADYFGTLKCLREVYEGQKNASAIKLAEVPAVLKDACTKSFRNADDKNICLRNGMSGLSVASLFAALDDETISFTTPDKNIVKKLFENHPAAQCRLDTYFQGAICDADVREEVSNTDEVKGTCHTLSGKTVGLRPVCWYKSKR